MHDAPSRICFAPWAATGRPIKRLATSRLYRCPHLFRHAAWFALIVLLLAVFPPLPLTASSFDPTVLVNTEAFQILDEGDSTADVELRFGDTLSEKIYWDRANAEFRFSDDIRADGNITGSGTLTVSGNVKTKADLTINADAGAADAVLTFGSDSTNETATFLNAQDRFEFSDDLRVTGGTYASGALIVDGAATFKSTLKLNSVTYTFPTSDGSASGKVLKTNSAGQLSWSTDANDGGSGISYADAKSYFVDDAGDTMTGSLTIKNAAGTNTGNTLTVDTKGLIYDATNKRVGILTSAPETTFEVVGSLSGRTLSVRANTTSHTGAVFVSQGGNGTGILIDSEATNAPVLALDAFANSSQLRDAPHILFGYRGMFSASIYRSATGTLTLASYASGKIIIDVERSGESTRIADLFEIIGDSGTGENILFRFESDGDAFADGVWNGLGADYAEWFFVGDIVSPGDIVCVDTTVKSTVRRCDTENSEYTVGVISERPGFLGNNGLGRGERAMVGLLGQVPTHVSGAAGAIRIGDPIAPSAQPGIGARATGPGRIVGFALESLTCPQENPSCTGTIRTYASPSWYEDREYFSAQEQAIHSLQNLLHNLAEELQRTKDILYQSLQQEPLTFFPQGLPSLLPQK